MSVWSDTANLPNAKETVRCYPNFTLPGGAMYVYGSDLSAKVQTYDDLMTYEPDGKTPITPDNYDPGVTSDYANYDEIVGVGADSTIAKVVRHDRATGHSTVIRGSMGIPIKRGKFIVVDTEAPLDGQFYYEATTDQGGVYRTSVCSVPSGRWRETFDHCVPVLFSDPLVVGRMQWASLLAIDPLSYPARQELYDVLLRHAPVALSGVRSTARTAFTVMTRTLTERADLLGLFMPGRVLLYRNPNPGYPENNWYIAVGEVTEIRIHPDHARPERKWQIEVAVVDRPQGLLTAADDRTYGDLRDFEPDGRTPISPPTYTGVNSDYADYLTALLGGPGGGGSVAPGVQPNSLVYLGANPITQQANKTSWSLLP